MSLGLGLALATALVALAPVALAESSPLAARATESRTMVTFSPVIRDNRLVFDDITVLDAQGSPLDLALYSVIPPTNDETNAFANGPVLMIDAQVGFTIGLNGKAVRANQPFTVTVVRQGETRSVRIQDLNRALTGRVDVEPVGALIFRGVPLQRVQVTQTYETSTASYRFVGIQPSSTADLSLSMLASGTGKRVIFRDTNNTTSTWRVQMRSSTTTSTSRFQAIDVKVPRGDQLVVTYSSWRGGSGRPTLWLDRHSDGRLDTKLPLVRG